MVVDVDEDVPTDEDVEGEGEMSLEGSSCCSSCSSFVMSRAFDEQDAPSRDIRLTSIPEVEDPMSPVKGVSFQSFLA